LRPGVSQPARELNPFPSAFVCGDEQLKAPAILIGQTVTTLKRVVIERVEPQVDDGAFPVKRVIGDRVSVRADIFADGHEKLGAVLLYRKADEGRWSEARMSFVENDRWEGQFTVDVLGRYFYTIVAWVDRFGTWRADLAKRAQAGQNISLELLIGAELLQAAADRAESDDARKLGNAAERLRRLSEREAAAGLNFAVSDQFMELMERHRDRSVDTQYDKELAVIVDPLKARFSAWYEMFPRSCTNDPERHGTFRDCIERLSYVAAMGFDVLYLPPIHPIGRTERKGRNNALGPAPDDLGSPWAIGGEEGGHKAIHPRLGTLEDFHLLRREAEQYGIALAMDLAYQTSPDHPYLREHPEWYRQRPDGKVQYAENPPKKYQDIYPFDFETERAQELWEELKSIVVYWIEQDVRIFRVDNPHTKPLAFWQWLIDSVKREYPDVIFLSEAFTRPKVMYRLAKLGFTQSYTYFAWKNTSRELTEYFTEINQTNVREYFRANLWPNTPDILNAYLQHGGRPAFMTRLILAATLGANYGIYGPAFELCENKAVREGSEEYLNSEKYQTRIWGIQNPNSLKDLITHVNAIRRANPALQSDCSLKFHPADNEQLIAYSKVSEGFANMLLMVVNLDPHNTQSGWVHVNTDEFHLGSQESYQVQDLLTGAHYVWHGSRNFVQLNPAILPAHLFTVRPIG
jgi:starch synthase (maltosyl-transferring)